MGAHVRPRCKFAADLRSKLFCTIEIYCALVAKHPSSSRPHIVVDAMDLFDIHESHVHLVAKSVDNWDVTSFGGASS